MCPDQMHRTPDEARLGRAIRRARLTEGLTQASLALRVGVSLAELQGYEMGALCIPAAVLATIADCLYVPIATLFGSLPDAEEAMRRPTRSLRLH